MLLSVTPLVRGESPTSGLPPGMVKYMAPDAGPMRWRHLLITYSYNPEDETPCAMQGHMEVALRNRVKLKALRKEAGCSYRRVGYPQFPKGEVEK